MWNEVLEIICAKTFLEEALWALLVFLCALVSWRAQLKAIEGILVRPTSLGLLGLHETRGPLSWFQFWLYVIGQHSTARQYYIVFIHFYSASHHSMILQKRSPPQKLTLGRSLHAEALQATVSEGLSQGPYMADRAENEPTTLRSKGVVSANGPPCPSDFLYPSRIHQAP